MLQRLFVFFILCRPINVPTNFNRLVSRRCLCTTLTTYLTTILFLSGCGKSFKSEALTANGNVKVLLLSNKQVNSELEVEEANPFEFKVVELFNIYDLVSLSGKYARFYTNATNKENNLKGTQPIAQFFKSKKGYFVAKNNFSLELATLYYHTQNLALIDQKIGANQLNLLPRKIVIGTKISNSSFQENNAIYDGGMDAIIFLNYTESNLALPFNGGIFAHEYFHSMFYKAVQKGLESNPFFKENSDPSESKIDLNLAVPKFEKNKFIENSKMNPHTLKKDLSLELNDIKSLSKQSIKDYYILLLKGLNEGIADFWGWAYSQDKNFILHSISKVPSIRTLDLKAHELRIPELVTQNMILNEVMGTFADQEEKSAYINYFSYIIGTRFALFFKELVTVISKERKLSTDEASTIVMKSIFTYLTQLGEKLVKHDFNQSKVDLISSQDLIFEFSQVLKPTKLPECQLILDTFNSDTKNSKKLSCLIKNEIYALSAPQEESASEK